MGLKKGQTNNPYGRPKGSQNKINKALRGKIANFIFDKIKDLSENWESLTPAEKIKFIGELLPYVLSKQNSHEDDLTKEPCSNNYNYRDQILRDFSIKIPPEE